MNDYQANGYANRRAYLEGLAEEYPRETVFALASMLGPNEDFDGLVIALEDYADKFCDPLGLGPGFSED